MISSDSLRRCLKYAELRKSPGHIPRTGEEAKKVRCISVYFELAGEQYLFDAIRHDEVEARRLRGGVYQDKVLLSLYDVWKAKPDIVQYWGLSALHFHSWAHFSLERNLHLAVLRAWVTQMCRKLENRRIGFRKATSVERFRLIRIVRDLSASQRGGPGQGAIATELLGKRWERYEAHLAPYTQMRRMLDALVELGELNSRNYTYVVTGKGIAALSQYEEEERKHKEAMSLQRRIGWLTIVMAVAALLQAKIIEFPPLLKLGAWPWG